MIPLAKPSIDNTDIAAVTEVLLSGQLVQGRKVEEFERHVSDIVGASNAVAVSNCTAALHLALLALNIKPDDLVAVPAYSWPATANVVELCGATPIFVDIEPDTFAMSASALAHTLDRVSGSTRTRGTFVAVIVVHPFGQMADMRAILKITEKLKIPVIEDAACALGALRNGLRSGGCGQIGCFSFHPRKAITTGEGGIACCNDQAVSDTMRTWRNHGQHPSASTPTFTLPGYNYRMTDVQAALGISQLQKYPHILDMRRKAAGQYHTLLARTSLTLPPTLADNQPVHQSYVVLLPQKYSNTQRETIFRLRELGVEATIGTWHIPMTEYYKTRYNYTVGNYPIADDIFQRALSLPLFDAITETEQEYVAECLRSLGL